MPIPHDSVSNFATASNNARTPPRAFSIIVTPSPFPYLTLMDSELKTMCRPVGGTEFSWCRAAPDGTGTTVLALLLSRPIPTLHLQTTLRNLHNSHPLHRASLTIPSASQPFIIVPPPGDSHPSLETLDSSATAALLERAPHTVSPFHALLEHELNRNPWAKGEPEPDVDEEGPKTRPVFFATVYELPGSPEPGSWVVALRLHTGFFDRTAAAHVLKDLLGLVGNTEDSKGHCDNREDGIIPGIEDLIPKQESWKPFWARGRDIIGYSLNGLRSAGVPIDQPGPPRTSEMVRMVLAGDDTRRLLHACDLKGIKLYGALLAAALIAIYSSKQIENNQLETYSAVTLIDCRKFLEPVLQDHHIGFYHSGIFNMHTVCGGEGLWDVAMRCHESFSTAKSNKKHLTDIGELNFLMCKAIDNPHLTPSSSLRTAVISVFEEPMIYESSEEKLRLGVEDYIGCASTHGVGPSIAVFDTIKDGQLDCAFVYPSPLHSRKQMEELVEHMKRILIEGSHGDELKY